MCREEPETGPSLEASEHQHDCSGVQKIVWKANMEKKLGETLWRYAEIGEYLGKILKRDLALDRTSGRRRMALSGQR